MELTKIELKNYKSVKQTIGISFFKGLPTVLIGKNGSGKTNVLEALNHIVISNGNQLYERTPGTRYRAYIKLSEADIEKMLPGIVYDENKCTLVAYNSGDELNIDRISSEYIVPSLKREIADVRELAGQLEKALDDYEKQLLKISHAGDDEIPINCYKLCNNNGGLTNYDNLRWNVELEIKNIREVLNNIERNFNDDEQALAFVSNGSLYFWGMCELKFKLSYVEPKLARFEEKFVSINRRAIKREITRINKATAESCEKIERLRKELDERTKRIHDGMDTRYTNQQEQDNKYFSFLKNIKRIVGNKCLYLKNENSDVFFKRVDRRYYDNRSNSVIETYLRHVYQGEDRDELLKESNQKLVLSDQAITDFEAYLNSNIPAFDKEMYESITVKRVGEENIAIGLNEKTGECIDINETSAGRRWYFTYYFMKNMLEAGDVFIIDEPAATLHPSAQKEVLNELLELANNGVRVIFSTHSPYLIPKERSCIHFVTMTEEGTKVRGVSSEMELLSQISHIVGGDIFDIQTFFDAYTKSDPCLIGENCYNAVLTKINRERKSKKERQRGEEKFSEAATEMRVSVDTIKSWNRKGDHFRCPKLENVIAVCKYTGIDWFELLK